MSGQNFAAAQVLEILQDLPSDCSGDKDSGSQNEEIINSTVARVEEFKVLPSDSIDNELDISARPDHAVAQEGVV